MKRLLSTLSIVAILALSTIIIPNKASAQIPGDFLSAGALAGAQSSSVSGIGMGSYFALRGSFADFFGEMRSVSWGNDNAYIRETGYLGGMDMSLLGLMIAGGVGIGSSSYQAPMATGATTLPAVSNYTSFIYEAQAMYQFDLIGSFVKAGVGVNYIGDTPITGGSGAPAINGLGAVASINVGL